MGAISATNGMSAKTLRRTHLSHLSTHCHLPHPIALLPRSLGNFCHDLHRLENAVCPLRRNVEDFDVLHRFAQITTRGECDAQVMPWICGACFVERDNDIRD